MNYFEIIAYSNIVLCLLVVILIVLNILKTNDRDNEAINSILMSNYEIERQLKSINSKLDKKY